MAPHSIAAACGSCDYCSSSRSSWGLHLCPACFLVLHNVTSSLLVSLFFFLPHIIQAIFPLHLLAVVSQSFGSKLALYMYLKSSYHLSNYCYLFFNSNVKYLLFLWWITFQPPLSVWTTNHTLSTQPCNQSQLSWQRDKVWDSKVYFVEMYFGLCVSCVFFFSIAHIFTHAI